MEWKNVWFYSSLFSFHRCYRRTWPCISLISWTYSHRPGFNKLFQEHNLQFEDFLKKHAFLLQKWFKPKKVYFQNVEKFFLDTPYTTCIKTEAVNNYTKWRNQVDQYRRETNQVNTRKNPTIYKKSQEGSKEFNFKMYEQSEMRWTVVHSNQSLTVYQTDSDISELLKVYHDSINDWNWEILWMLHFLYGQYRGLF